MQVVMLTMQEKKLTGKHNLKKAEAFLSNLDADWSKLIQKVGPCEITISNLEPYQSLIKSVIFQQLHPKAASTIYDRFLSLFNNQPPHASSILEMDPNLLTQCGLSKNKLVSILDIACSHHKHTIPNSNDLKHMNDEEIIEKLIVIKGVGRWTIEMMLIFNLGRLDIMPATDFAIKSNYQKMKKLDHISPSLLLIESKKWQPYRSVAAWYLWRY